MPVAVSGSNGQAGMVNVDSALAAITSPKKPGDDAPDWMSAFPKKRLRLGLDLVGGSHLGLGVDTEEALRAIRPAIAAT